MSIYEKNATLNVTEGSSKRMTTFRKVCSIVCSTVALAFGLVAFLCVLYLLSEVGSELRWSLLQPVWRGIRYLFHLLPFLR